MEWQVLKVKARPKPIFPLLDEYVRNEYGNVTAFCQACGFPKQVYYRFMYETGNPKMLVIKSILEQTGMSFDDAFEEGIMGQSNTTTIVFPNLERWIKEHCGSYIEFARQSGIHRCTISDLIAGRTTPRWDTILAILDFTEMTFEECFGGAKHVQQ